MAKRIKILHLGSPAGLYGAERWIISLIKQLDPGTIKSSVGVIRDIDCKDIPLCVEADRLNFPTCVIEARGRFNWSAVRALRTHILDNHIDIVHTHFYKTDVIGLLATIGTNCKIISTPHGWTNDPPITLRIYESFSRMLFPFMDAVVPLSQDMLNPLQNGWGFRSNLHLIRNAVDIGEVDAVTVVADEISVLRQEGRFVLGYIGRLVSGKGLDTLLTTIARHPDRHWHVALVGEGEQENELRSMAIKLRIADRIHFFGFRSNRLAFLNGFDAFILPSRSEGIPRCLMESLAAGIPVIATDIPGCRNLIDGKKTGLLFPVDDVDALGTLIQLLNDTDVLKKTLAQQGRTFVEDHFSAVRMARQYEELYGALLR